MESCRPLITVPYAELVYFKAGASREIAADDKESFQIFGLSKLPLQARGKFEVTREWRIACRAIILLLRLESITCCEQIFSRFSELSSTTPYPIERISVPKYVICKRNRVLRILFLKIGDLSYKLLLLFINIR